MKYTFKNTILLLTLVLALASCQYYNGPDYGYEKKGGKVYYTYVESDHQMSFWDNGIKHTILVEEADASTFSKIKTKPIPLGKDKNNVFYEDKVLRYADPVTFDPITEYYWKDKKFVYFFQSGGIIHWIFDEYDLTASNIDSFRERFFIKGNYLYAWPDDSGNIKLLCEGFKDFRIENTDPKTFEVIKDNLNWAKDKNHVFFGLTKIKNVNPNQFTVINSNWGKDDKFYYYKDEDRTTTMDERGGGNNPDKMTDEAVDTTY